MNWRLNDVGGGLTTRNGLSGLAGSFDRFFAPAEAALSKQPEQVSSVCIPNALLKLIGVLCA